MLTWSNHSTTGEHFAFLCDYKPRINDTMCACLKLQFQITDMGLGAIDMRDIPAPVKL